MFQLEIPLLLINATFLAMSVTAEQKINNYLKSDTYGHGELQCNRRQ